MHSLRRPLQSRRESLSVVKIFRVKSFDLKSRSRDIERGRKGKVGNKGNGRRRRRRRQTRPPRFPLA